MKSEVVVQCEEKFRTGKCARGPPLAVSSCLDLILFLRLRLAFSPEQHVGV